MGAFDSYYQGGQFTSKVTLNTAGDIEAIDSVSVNHGNTGGVSETLTVSIQQFGPVGTSARSRQGAAPSSRAAILTRAFLPLETCTLIRR